MRVDVIDRQIIAELQVDGRLAVTELAARVSLSAGPRSPRSSLLQLALGQLCP
jgi:DNA-binding Lrp family transcriptional regulator